MFLLLLRPSDKSSTHSELVCHHLMLNIESTLNTDIHVSPLSAGKGNYAADQD